MPIAFHSSSTVLVELALAYVALVVFICYYHAHSLTDLAGVRRSIALGIRLSLVSLLFLALAQPRIVRRDDRLTVIFLIDQSASIRSSERTSAATFASEAGRAAMPGDSAAIVTFANHAEVGGLPAASLPAATPRHSGKTDATDINEALTAASSLVPAGGAARFVVISDFNETQGSALAGAAEAAARGIRVDTVPLRPGLVREALVDKVLTPAHVHIGEPFDVHVVTSQANAQHAALDIATDASLIGERHSVDLSPGKQGFSYRARFTSPGAHRITVQLITNPNEDTIPQNNRGYAVVNVEGRPRVLYVAAQPDQVRFLRRGLALNHVDVLYAPPSALPSTPEALQQFDTILLSDVPMADLTVAQMEALQVATRDLGVGFAMIGGYNSFGAGGFRHSPIEDMLPVSLDVKQLHRIPAVAVVLVIEDLEVAASINMSKEAAKATVDLLDPIDQVGVLSCTGIGSSYDWPIPLQHAVDRTSIERKIDALKEMGDPPTYDAYLLAAAKALERCDARVKHIVFLGDGDATYEADQRSVTASMARIRDMGVSVSTVASGADGSGIKFLAAIAQLGGGNAYVADAPGDLPRILLKDQQTFSAPPIVEEPFNAVTTNGADESLIPGSAVPPLLGYNVTLPKASAMVSLVTHRSDPLLATWRYGLGRSLAFTSDDKNRWAANWLPWSGYGKFWAQAIRWTMRSSQATDFQTQVALDGGRAHVMVDAIDNKGQFLNGLALQGRVVASSGGANTASELAVNQTAPGRYEAWFDASHTGTYLVNVTHTAASGRTESSVAGLAIPYSPEYRDLNTNMYLANQVAAVGSGRLNPKPSQVFTADRPIAYSYRSLTQALLIAVLLLIPIDVGVRRLALRREDFVRLFAWLRRRPMPVQAATGPLIVTPALSRLQGARERAFATTQRPRDEDSSGLETAGPAAAHPADAATKEVDPVPAAAAASEVPTATTLERLKAARERRNKGSG